MRIRQRIRDVRVLNHLMREQPSPVANAVRVTFRDRLEDRLRPIRFAGMDRLPNEVGVYVLVGRAVVIRRITRLGARQVETDDR